MNEPLTLTPELPVSAIAATYPVTLRMLEALGIDYCCGGKLPLAEAAAQAGIPVATAIAVLQTAIAQSAGAAMPETNWQQAPLTELMHHIVQTHHAYMHSEMPRLQGLLTLVTRVHGPNHGEVLRPLLEQYLALRHELTVHLKKEEDVTFPAIERLLERGYDETATVTIAELADEHDAAGAVLHAMRKTTANYALPADACATFRAVYDGLQILEADIHRHIHLENNILFPRALQLARECACSAA